MWKLCIFSIVEYIFLGLEGLLSLHCRWLLTWEKQWEAPRHKMPDSGRQGSKVSDTLEALWQV
jgi:hypothetical protein